MIRFILGGARSGKSRYAEQLAIGGGKAVVYVATAQAYDDEMQTRISHHKKQRPAKWVTIEETLKIDKVLSNNSNATYCILIDCLTLWLTNLLCENHDIMTAKQAFLDALCQSESDIILVSNETGMGVVPMGELTRRYCDEVGWLHQEIAALADQVVLMVAGIPMIIKEPVPVSTDTTTPAFIKTTP